MISHAISHHVPDASTDKVQFSLLHQHLDIYKYSFPKDHQGLKHPSWSYSPSSRPSIISDNAPAAVIRSHALRAIQLKVIATDHDWAALATHLWSSLSIIMWMEGKGLHSPWPTNLACTSCNAASLCCNAVYYCMGQFSDLLLIFSLKLIPNHLQR